MPQRTWSIVSTSECRELTARAERGRERVTRQQRIPADIYTHIYIYIYASKERSLSEKPPLPISRARLLSLLRTNPSCFFFFLVVVKKDGDHHALFSPPTIALSRHRKARNKAHSGARAPWSRTPQMRCSTHRRCARARSSATGRATISQITAASSARRSPQRPTTAFELTIRPWGL